MEIGKGAGSVKERESMRKKRAMPLRASVINGVEILGRKEQSDTMKGL